MPPPLGVAAKADDISVLERDVAEHPNDEQAAVDYGYAVARLDTGPQQPHAQRLYERSGYVEVAEGNRSGADLRARLGAVKRLGVLRVE